MKDINTTPTGQIVRDVFGDRLVRGDELARFLVGLAWMKAGPDGSITDQIIKEFAAVFDAQQMVISELKGEYTPE